MKQPEYHLVRITRHAKDQLVKFTSKKNKNVMQVNASRFISEAIIKAIAKEKEKSNG